MSDFFGEPTNKRPRLEQARTEETREEEPQEDQSLVDPAGVDQTRVEQASTEEAPTEQTLVEEVSVEEELVERPDEEIARPEAPHETQSNDNNSVNVNSAENADNPRNWSLGQVWNFINNIPGCSYYADDFAEQEIDGEALFLLKAELLTAVGLLEPEIAVIIMREIDKIRPPKED